MFTRRCLTDDTHKGDNKLARRGSRKDDTHDTASFDLYIMVSLVDGAVLNKPARCFGVSHFISHAGITSVANVLVGWNDLGLRW